MYVKYMRYMRRFLCIEDTIQYIYLIGYVCKISKNQAFFFSSCFGRISLVINKELSNV